MPLYDMVVELLVGVGAWYVFVFLSLCMLIIFTEILDRLSFSSDGLFVNLGNVATTGIGISNNQVVVTRGCILIVFISNGCVATCNLFAPGTCGSGIHINHVKKIRIWPLNEEFDALTAYFGTIYGISQFYCNFFGNILTFQTRIEKASSSNQSWFIMYISFFSYW